MRVFLQFGSRRMLFWILCFVILTAGISLYIESGISKSEPYLIAQRFLTKNREVIQNLGEPKKFSLTAFGDSKMETLGLEGKANFDISILGAKDKGKAVVKLEERAGVWYITDAVLVLKNGRQVELKEDQ